MTCFTRLSTGAALLTFVIAAMPVDVSAQRSGVTIWSQTCGNCHMIQPANRYTVDQWETMMQNMQLHARLTDDEATAVLNFLKSGAKILATASPPPEPAVTVLASTEPAPWLTALDPETDYAQQCAACHGNGGQGNGPAAIAFNPKPTNLVDPEFLESRTDEALISVIVEGRDAMPGFRGLLTADQVAALVVYIRQMEEEQKKR